MRDEFFWRDCLPGLEAHERLHGLAAFLVRDADHRRLTHRGVLCKDVLDLARPDLVPRRIDHVFLAVDDEYPAFGAHEAHVAAHQGTARKVGRRLFGLAPVASHDLGAYGDDLAYLAQRDVLAVIANDPHDGVRYRQPDRELSL